MKLVTFRDGGWRSFGVIQGEAVTKLSGAGSVGDALKLMSGTGSRRAESGASVAIRDLKLVAPIDDAARVFGIAQNFPSHASEMGGTRPPKPVVFLKPASSIADPQSDVGIPALSEFFDYEGELGAVIGSPCAGVAVHDALSHVAGYTICNDGSARDLQTAILGGKPLIDWFSSKSLDRSSPVGPWIATADEIPDPQAVQITTRLNGEVVQQESTASMVFSVAEQVSWISQRVALRPGDLLMTGTPGGVGASRGRSLQPGDVIEIEIDPIGVLRSRYVVLA